MSKTLTEIFLNKPENIIDLPEWMISHEEIKGLQDRPGVAIVELAGRDSVAAALKVLEDEEFSVLVPTYVYTGSEFGDWTEVERARDRLASRLPSGVELAPLLLLGSPQWWHALNGRYLQELTSRFGFCPACPGCHLYLHAARIPLARMLGNAPVIAGERLSHDGRAKLNQLAQAQEAYSALFEQFGLRLLLPLSEIHSGREIERILDMDWPEGGEQLDCVLSGNYLDTGKSLPIAGDRLEPYFRLFALPLAQQTAEAYMAGQVPEHAALATQLLSA